MKRFISAFAGISKTTYNTKLFSQIAPQTRPFLYTGRDLQNYECSVVLIAHKLEIRLEVEKRSVRDVDAAHHASSVRCDLLASSIPFTGQEKRVSREYKAQAPHVSQPSPSIRLVDCWQTCLQVSIVGVWLLTVDFSEGLCGRTAEVHRLRHCTHISQLFIQSAGGRCILLAAGMLSKVGGAQYERRGTAWGSARRDERRKPIWDMQAGTLSLVMHLEFCMHSSLESLEENLAMSLYTIFTGSVISPPGSHICMWRIV